MHEHIGDLLSKPRHHRTVMHAQVSRLACGLHGETHAHRSTVRVAALSVRPLAFFLMMILYTQLRTIRQTLMTGPHLSYTRIMPFFTDDTSRVSSIPTLAAHGHHQRHPSYQPGGHGGLLLPLVFVEAPASRRPPALDDDVATEHAC